MTVQTSNSYRFHLNYDSSGPIKLDDFVILTYKMMFYVDVKYNRLTGTLAVKCTWMLMDRWIQPFVFSVFPLLVLLNEFGVSSHHSMYDASLSTRPFSLFLLLLRFANRGLKCGRAMWDHPLCILTPWLLPFISIYFSKVRNDIGERISGL